MRSRVRVFADLRIVVVLGRNAAEKSGNGFARVFYAVFFECGKRQYAGGGGDSGETIARVCHTFLDGGAIEFVGFVHQYERGRLPDDAKKGGVFVADSAAAIHNQNGAGDLRFVQKFDDSLPPHFLFFARHGGVAVAGQIGENMPAGEGEKIDHSRASGRFGGARESSAANRVDDAGFSGIGFSGKDNRPPIAPHRPPRPQKPRIKKVHCRIVANSDIPPFAIQW